MRTRFMPMLAVVLAFGAGFVLHATNTTIVTPATIPASNKVATVQPTPSITPVPEAAAVTTQRTDPSSAPSKPVAATPMPTATPAPTPIPIGVSHRPAPPSPQPTPPNGNITWLGY